MDLSYSINCSENAVVINLDQAHIEQIVEERLNKFLKKKPQGKSILKNFYEPVERALIEFSLIRQKGNQLKTAKILGINRNTLKKKIIAYNLNIKDLLMKQEGMGYPHNQIFLGSISSFDLLEACRAKMATENFQNELSEGEILKTICQPVEKTIIHRVLEYCNGNQIRASLFLGINRNTLKKKISSTVETWAH